MTRASCLCGDVVWELDGPFELMSHCHCSRCRKAHGAAFATYVAAPTYLTAIVAGLLSFLSPCVLPLVPAYLGYLSGHTMQKV